MINESVATIDDGVWQCSEIKMRKILNNWLEIRQLTASPEDQMFAIGSPSVPDPDYFIATEAVKDFGGKLLSSKNAPPLIVSNGKIIKDSEIIY